MANPRSLSSILVPARSRHHHSRPHGRFRHLWATDQVACRLHAVLCELVPGGVRKEITAGHAARLLEAAQPSGPVETARWQLASDFLDDLRLFTTVAGADSPHTTSTSRPVLTTCPSCKASAASTALRRSPFTGRGPPSTATSTGPSSRTCIAVPALHSKYPP
jgi:hypothetical protein